MTKKKTTTKSKATPAPETTAMEPEATAVAEPPIDDTPQPEEPSQTPRERFALGLPPLNPVQPEASQDPPPAPPEFEADPPLAYVEEVIEDTVEQLAAVESELSDEDVHPEIKLPMKLIRDKKFMCEYAKSLGRTPMEAQGRREKLKLTPGIMHLYRIYKQYCERRGKRYWTERGFAATLICYHRGVPLEEPDQEPEQDILARIGGKVTRDQNRK